LSRLSSEAGLLLHVGQAVLDLLVILLPAREHAHPDFADALLRTAEVSQILRDGATELRQQALLLRQAVTRQIALGRKLP
jgi:hypothetical protein